MWEACFANARSSLGYGVGARSSPLLFTLDSITTGSTSVRNLMDGLLRRGKGLSFDSSMYFLASSVKRQYSKYQIPTDQSISLTNSLFFNWISWRMQVNCKTSLGDINAMYTYPEQFQVRNIRLGKLSDFAMNANMHKTNYSFLVYTSFRQSCLTSIRIIWIFKKYLKITKTINYPWIMTVLYKL